MSIFDVADEVAAMLEPTAGNRDDARVRPFQYVPGKLYLWPIGEQYVPIDTGGSDRLNFRLRAAWTVASEQEEASLVSDRSISQAVQVKAGGYHDAVDAARIVPGGGSTWDWLQVDAVDYDSLSTTHARGFLMDLSGYMTL